MVMFTLLDIRNDSKISSIVIKLDSKVADLLYLYFKLSHKNAEFEKQTEFPIESDSN